MNDDDDNNNNNNNNDSNKTKLGHTNFQVSFVATFGFMDSGKFGSLLKKHKFTTLPFTQKVLKRNSARK
jgi:hypothetical protein